MIFSGEVWLYKMWILAKSVCYMSAGMWSGQQIHNLSVQEKNKDE